MQGHKVILFYNGLKRKKGPIWLSEQQLYRVYIAEAVGESQKVKQEMLPLLKEALNTQEQRSQPLHNFSAHWYLYQKSHIFRLTWGILSETR